MIVCNSRKFVFVKTRKTASTSVEIFLHPYLDLQDIWTPLSEPVVPGNRYYSIWPFDLAAARFKPVRRRLGKRSPVYFRFLDDHASLKRLYRGYGARRFRNYFKFCFERNPWDYVVSMYHYYYRGSKRPGGRPDFDTFLESGLIRRNWDLYTINGRVAVDAVYRFEDLDAHMVDLIDKLNLSVSDLPRHKVKWRKEANYRAYYTPATRDRVAKIFAPMIERFGYDF